MSRRPPGARPGDGGHRIAPGRALRHGGPRTTVTGTVPERPLRTHPKPRQEAR